MRRALTREVHVVVKGDREKVKDVTRGGVEKRSEKKVRGVSQRMSRKTVEGGGPKRSGERRC